MKPSRILCAAALTAPLLLAHTGEKLQPHDLWSAWSYQPVIMVLLADFAILYWRGFAAARTPAWQIACFWSGWLVLALSLLSPVHALGEQLFAAHMLQHEL